MSMFAMPGTVAPLVVPAWLHDRARSSMMPGSSPPAASAVRPLPPPASITLVDHGAARRTLVLTGEWDMANARQLDDAAGRALADVDGALRLTVDLRDVTFLDSLILGRLLRIEETVTGGGGTLAVCCSPGAVARTFEITGLAAKLGVEVVSNDADDGDQPSAA
jgi:anti-anti-sigma factor